MAKVGQTDPRWIVAERHDGVNVNSWHWDSKDKTKVCESRLKELFQNRLLYDSELFIIESQSLSDFEGDVTIANRKGKLKCFFEFKFNLKFEARPKEKGTLVPFEGKMNIPDCDTQNYVEEYAITVSSEEKGLEKQEEALKAVQTFGRNSIRSITRNFIEEELMASNGVDSTPMQVKSHTNITKSTNTSSSPSKSENSSSLPVDAINFQIDWKVGVKDIWDCFTKEDKISCFTRAACNMKARVCGDFSMLGGTITGTFVELVECKRLVMKWRLSSWKSTEGNSSVVTVDFSGSDENCTMIFSHAGVPSHEYDRVKKGWETNFWDAMKMILGYGNNRGEN